MCKFYVYLYKLSYLYRPKLSANFMFTCINQSTYKPSQTWKGKIFKGLHSNFTEYDIDGLLPLLSIKTCLHSRQILGQVLIFVFSYGLFETRFCTRCSLSPWHLALRGCARFPAAPENISCIIMSNDTNIHPYSHSVEAES